MPLRFPRLSSLRIFEAAGRHLNFKHAAIELRVTPNAMSHVIMGWRRCPGSNPGLEATAVSGVIVPMLHFPIGDRAAGLSKPAKPLPA